MINKINFKGNVFMNSELKRLTPKNEMSELKSYSNQYDVDIFVYDRSYYVDNTGIYDAVVAKNGMAWHKNFDMKFDKKSHLNEMYIGTTRKEENVF